MEILTWKENSPPIDRTEGPIDRTKNCSQLIECPIDRSFRPIDRLGKPLSYLLVRSIGPQTDRSDLGRNAGLKPVFPSLWSLSFPPSQYNLQPSKHPFSHPLNSFQPSIPLCINHSMNSTTNSNKNSSFQIS